MSSQLTISVGQYSDRGRKESNQDFHGAVIPEEPLLSTKGIAIALADGISSSDVSHVASESAVKGFLEDYYCTSEAWPVRASALRVLNATNSWLYAQSRRQPNEYESDRGYVCTLSAMVIRSATAHIFHVGDSRVYRLSGQSLEQLTEDHRLTVSSQQTYLSRAMGIHQALETDYQALPVEPGDIFVLVTDGVYEHVTPDFFAAAISENAGDLDRAAAEIAGEAFRQGSMDNLTIQIVRIDTLPSREADEILGRMAGLSLPPLLEPRMLFDGYRIVRALHGSSRSHIYLAVDEETDELVALKIPSIDLRGDQDYLKRFMMEEWIARRLNSPHVLKPCRQTRPRKFLYVAMEYVDGQTLAQWMIDNPRSSLESVRGIVEQIARGLLAFHRLQMLHQDIRPENIVIDRTGTVKIIDFGSTRVSGILDSAIADERGEILGTTQYAAPEYFIGETGTTRSDLYSLGAIAYQMLCGRLPYGANVAKARTKAAQRRLQYISVLDDGRDLPTWVDRVLQKAVHPDPEKRYAELSELTFDLRHPNRMLGSPSVSPLLARNPLAFWRGVSVILAFAVMALLAAIGLMHHHGLHL